MGAWLGSWLQASGSPPGSGLRQDQAWSGVATTPPPRRALVCEGLTVRYRDRPQPTLRDVRFVLPAGRLLAVVGPSGSGKSTLCSAILGEVGQVEGRVMLDGVDLLQARSVSRRLVSFVPQRDALHNELTPRRALSLTAALRLAPGVPAAERARRVDQMLDLLEIREHASARIGHLSGGQRKRVAVAMELLSDPLLLMLDEPTAGLDEGLDRIMMQVLRRIADAGVAVLVVTHSTANLALADTVLALGSTGRLGYCGAPSRMLEAFAASSYAEAMQALRVTAGEPSRRRASRSNRRRAAGRATGRPETQRSPVPDAAELRDGALLAFGAQAPAAGGSELMGRSRVRHTSRRRGAAMRSAALRTGALAGPDGASGGRIDLGVGHCTRVLTAREFRRMLATPRTVARGLLLLPLLTVLLTAWADKEGLAGWVAEPNRMQGAAMSVLINCTTFFAMALSFSTVVGDRAVIEREYRWGVPPVAVVLSKTLALLGPVIFQTGVTLTAYLSVRKGPDHVVAGWPVWLALGAGLGLMGVASLCLGLVISAVSARLDRAVYLLMGTLTVLVVLTGLLIPLDHPSGLGSRAFATASEFAPTRWGTAAVAAYIGFVPIELLDRGIRATSDPLWVQGPHNTVRAWLSLAAQALIYVLAAAYLLARQLRRRR